VAQFIPNPINPVTPIGQSFANLAQTLMSAPSTAEREAQRLDNEYRAAQARKLTGEAVGLENTNRSVSGIADLFAGLGGEAPDASALSSLGAAFVSNPEQLADLNRLFSAQQFGAADPRTVAAQVGAGGAYNTTAAGVREGFDADRNKAMSVAAYNMQNDPKNMAFRALPPELQGLAVGPSASQTQGGLLAEHFSGLAGLDDYQRKALGAQPGGGISFTTNPDGTTSFNMGGDKTAMRQSDDRTRSYTDFKQTLASTRAIAERDPTLFGIAGNVRSITQDVVGQLQNARLVAGGSIENALVDAEQNLNAAGWGGTFDRNLSDIDKMSILLAYGAAGALADQSGRGLSDKDFAYFRQLIGNPRDLLMTQQKFLATMDMVGREVDYRIAAERRRRGLPEQAPDAAPQGPVDPTTLSDEELLRMLGAP
jgi:hypothetical protein